MLWWILGFVLMAFLLLRGVESMLEDWRDNPWWKNATAVAVCATWVAGTLRVGYEAVIRIIS